MSNKMIKILFLIGITIFVLTVLGATYAYFTVGNSIATSSRVNADVEGVGSVALSGGAELTKIISAADMAQSKAPSTYDLGTASIATATLTDSYNTVAYYCEFTLTVTNESNMTTNGSTDGGINIEVADNVSIETVSGGEFTLGENLVPTSINSGIYKVTFQMGAESNVVQSGTSLISLSGSINNSASDDTQDERLAGKSIALQYDIENFSCSAKKVETYNITYNLNGGEFEEEQPTTYTNVTETFTLGIPSKENYTFTGWTGSNGTTPQTSVTIAKGSTGDKTYTANWQGNSYAYNVVYKSSTGVILGSTTVSKSFGTTNTISAPEKTGYTTPASQSVTWDSTTAKTITFTYTPITYNITINNNGGSGVSSSTYTIESSAITLGTPSRTGYTFTGWTGTGLSSATKTVTISKGSTGDRNYTANWSANSYTYSVVYKSSTGVSLGSTTVTKNYGTTNTISAPAKTGYTTPASQSVSWDSTTSKTITFTYTPIKYSITINNNGGSGVSSSTYTIESSAITLGTPTRTDYIFTGWTGSNGTTPQTSVTIAKGSTGDKTYTANWQEDKIYLFNYGDNTSVTGGFTAHAQHHTYAVWYNYAYVETGSTYGTAAPKYKSQSDGSMYIYSGGGTHGGVYRTTNKIDLTDYTTLYFNGSMSGNNRYFCIWSNMGTYLDSNLVKSVSSNISSSAYAIDVSSLSGEYYIGFFVYSSYDNVTIKQMWME